MPDLRDLVGYRMFGRCGEIGRVVDTGSADRDDEPVDVVVRGGVSDALVYHVPEARLLSVSPDKETVHADVDVGDFVPRLNKSGTVELRLA